jgi:hypothetical protein
MSGPSGHGHGDAGGANDAVDYGKVIMVGVASLMIFAGSIAWAGWLMGHQIAAVEAQGGKQNLEFDRTRTEIGIVDQVPFVTDKRLPGWRAERKRALETYGWIDKSKGVVRIPIEAAIEKVVGGTMPAGAPK